MAARNPLPALLVVALVPAVALAGVWRLADGRAPADVAGAPTDADGTTVITDPSVLTTPLLSVRRAPSTLARDANIGAFQASLEQVLATIDNTSCLSLSIDGQLVAEKNATVSLRPASNVKLVTAAVALEVLGPDFTYATEVTGTVGPDGVVNGDLYLVGGGDPVLTSSWWKGPNTKYPPFNTTSIEALADAVVDAGVTRVTGRIVGDASRYDGEWYAPTWTPDVRFSEGGPVSALLANDSRERVDRSSADPAQGAAQVLTDLLRERGVTVASSPVAGSANPAAGNVALIESAPLTDILAEMLTTSDNTTAEMVLKEVGLKAGAGPTREAGLAVVTERLTTWGIPLDGVLLVDGSGLSDENRMTCASLLAVLHRHTADDPVGAGLPVGGAAGGTLSDAFVGTSLEGRVQAKTGTLYNYDDGIFGKPAVKALAGFIPLDGGGEIEFAMLLNGPQIAEQVQYRPIWDLFALVVGTYPSGPSVSDLAPR